MIWILHIGLARDPGPGTSCFPPPPQVNLPLKIVNVGGWLTYGDLALDSCDQFLAVAEHQLIPSRVRSIGHLLRRAGHQSVWSTACQDQVAGGHAWSRGVSLGGAPLSLPSSIAPQFKEFFRLGRALRTTLPTGKGGVVHLFVVYGYQGHHLLRFPCRHLHEIPELVRCHHQLVLHLDSKFSLDSRAHSSDISVSRLLTVLRRIMISIVHIVVLP